MEAAAACGASRQINYVAEINWLMLREIWDCKTLEGCAADWANEAFMNS